MFGRFLRSRAAEPPTGTVPPGERVYAIGDVHGRLDLLDELIAAIDADDAARGPARTTIIFLGDLIDRGPNSAQVVERVRRLAAERGLVRVLMGNHEEIFLAALDGDEKTMRFFCRIGGHETCLSYGISVLDYESLSDAELAVRFGEVVPPSHVDFVRGFEDIVRIGDYAFVHAGVRPGVALDEQKPSDLRWIRSEFLDHRGRFGAVIVHGHTITADVELRSNRIGIDTGAYASGRLTALGLEGDLHWILAAGAVETPVP